MDERLVQFDEKMQKTMNNLSEAENGAIAVEKYPEAKPDLVLMDITMPDMDGIQALKKIKQI